MKKKWCFSKWIVVILIAMYVEQIVFGQMAMWHFGNLDSLPEMWVNVVPPVIGIIGYFIKSGMENRRGGITYDCAMKESEENGLENSIDEPVKG